MKTPRQKQKEIEKRYLEEARRKGNKIPTGEIREFEEPDFVIETPQGALGVEVSEVLRPGQGLFAPVEEERFHQEVVQIAEREYRQIRGAQPVDVLVYFWNAGDKKRDKLEVASSLVEFVRVHRVPKGAAETFSDNLPEGFGVIRVLALDGSWSSGESGGTTPQEIYLQLARRIDAKNQLLLKYRTNLPGSEIWLLLYSGFSVSRGVPIPHGLADWSHPFDFDRVLFFSSLDFEEPVVEIRKGPSQGQH